MSKAAQLAAQLESLEVAAGMDIIETAQEEALYFDVIGNVLCIMHSDGSVNMIDRIKGRVLVETISSANILKVLKHYRPFKEVFKRNVQ